LSILEALDSYGPLKLTHIMQKANVNCNVLKNNFDFLVKQGAVEEKYVERGKIVYAITELGLQLNRYFKNQKHVVSTVKLGEITSNKTKNELNHNENKKYC
jgi:predicted transcriptional regulator